MNIVDLPKDILGQVLSYWDSSYLLIPLWKCGNRLLNSKLASGVQYIDLIHYSGLLSQYPLLISELTQLRHLHLKSPFIIMGNGLEWPDQLFKLPRTLETLSVESADLPHSILNVSHKSTASVFLPLKASIPTFRHLFPRLSTLALDGQIEPFLLELPFALTSLTVPSLDSSCDLPIISILPRTLRFLNSFVKVRFMPSTTDSLKAAWISAPPDLEFITTLEWTGLDTDLTWIPRSLLIGDLQYVNIVFREAIKSDSPHWRQIFSTLPPRLEQLKMPRLPLQMVLQGLSTDVASLLPRTLKELHINALNLAAIRLLPSSLTKLTLSADTDWKMDDVGANVPLFPPTLQTLLILLPHPDIGILKLIPSTLTSLRLITSSDNGSNFDLDLLPPNLTYLEILLTKTIQLQNNWPKRLSNLRLVNTGSECQMNHNHFDLLLPSSITSLRLYGSAPAAYDVTDALFPNLRTLNVEDWHTRLSSRTLPRSLTKISVSEFKLLIDDENERNDYFATLPSSLAEFVVLTMEGLKQPSSASFSSLPRLSKLQIDTSVVFPTAVLQNLPGGIRDVSLGLDSPDDVDYAPLQLRYKNLVTRKPQQLVPPIGKSLIFPPIF